MLLLLPPRALPRGQEEGYLTMGMGKIFHETMPRCQNSTPQLGLISRVLASVRLSWPTLVWLRLRQDRLAWSSLSCARVCPAVLV